ncbi:uncharacterized protein LOC142241416 isoform X2 [Haematobia irritans]|uniref:uncharacterized protein LOC142241416 isoform X2 n=1 Tax=Haematobia irritans TaxID=7368 RepID=UPI003F501144
MGRKHKPGRKRKMRPGKKLTKQQQNVCQVKKITVKRLLKRSKKIVLDANKTANKIFNISHRNKSISKKVNTPKNQKQNRNVANFGKKETNSIKDNEENSKQKESKDTMESDEDDCIVVETPMTHITIVDDDDDSENKNSSLSTISDYQSLSFCNTLSSTPLTKVNDSIALRKGQIRPNYKSNRNNIRASPLSCNQYRPTYSDIVSNKTTNIYNPPVPGNAPFFIDVNEKSFLGHIKYNYRVPARDTNDEEDDIVIIDNDTTLKSKSLAKEKTNNATNNLVSYSSSNNSSSDESTSSSDSSKEDGEIADSTINVDDESVIFVSDTNPNDFIPINNVGHNKMIANNQNHNTSPKKLPTYRGLFTSNEKKQLEAYNSNAYNPNAGEVFTSKKRMVFIDGSNVAFKHSLNKCFSVKGLKIAIEYFEKMGHDVKAVIPQFRMNNYKSSDPAELEKLAQSGKIVQTPCKNLPGLTSTSYDDRFILQLAAETDGAIVSNDNYRDLLHENPAFKKIIETRVIGYTWCNDIFILPKDPYGKWGPTLDMILNRT